MKNLFIYSGILFTFLSFSYAAVAQSAAKGKWAAGIVFSPDYAFRTINFPDSEAPWKEYLDEKELPIFGYTTGITLLYSLANKLELESGLLFSAKGFAFKLPGEEGWYVPESESADGWDIKDPSLPLEATTTHNYRFLDVPVKTNFFFLQKKIRLFLSAGVSASFFLDEFVVQEEIYTDRKETNRYIQDDVDFNAVNLSLTGGAGIEYSFSDRLAIRLNPEFRHAVTPLADTPGKYYLWSVGVNTGIFFRFKSR